MLAPDLAGRTVDSDGGVGLLVRIDPHQDPRSPLGRNTAQFANSMARVNRVSVHELRPDGGT